jgi:hypothetical protein
MPTGITAGLFYFKLETAMNKSTLSRANAAFHKKDYETALLAYQEALRNASENIRQQIVFNLEIVKRRLNIKGIVHESEFTNSNETEVLTVTSSTATQNADHKEVVGALKEYFDEAFYLATYPDVAQSKLDPLWHFVATGWKEGRNPCSEFSTMYYLQSNRDVADAGINPFWHYIVAGKAEGRRKSHPGGYKAEKLSSLLPLKQMIIQWKTLKKIPKLLCVTKIADLIIKSKTENINQLAISIGHDHYIKVSGGIQLCIQREAGLAADAGVLYLNAHPWQPLPLLANEENADPLLCLILAGKDLGVCHASALTSAIAQVSNLFDGNINTIIHSLLGHSVEWVKQLANLADNCRSWLWLHDFFTLCPSFTLQRNTISYCGAPEQKSNACTICLYSEERTSHVRRIRGLLEDIEVTVVSPSEVTKAFWLSKMDFPADRVIVAPHVDLQWFERETPLKVERDLPITIGFLGAPVSHKGWNTFELLARALAHDPRFRFIYFGHYKLPLSGVETVNVHVTAQDEFRMTRAISECQVDFVIHWASWPETFSFTTYEAIAAGAHILTNSISGNVAATVIRTGMGTVFDDERALNEFFSDGEANITADRVRTKRATRFCRSSFSNMTLPFVMKERV